MARLNAPDLPAPKKEKIVATTMTKKRNGAPEFVFDPSKTGVATIDPSKSVALSQERLQELAADESNRVYDFEYDTVERILPPDEVTLKLKAIIGIVKDNVLKHGAPGTSGAWKWQQHKDYLRDNFPELYDMRRTHPKMFDVVSHPRSDPIKDIAPVFNILTLKQLVLDGKVTEMEAMKTMSGTLQEHFKLPVGRTKDDVTPWGVSERPD